MMRRLALWMGSFALVGCVSSAPAPLSVPVPQMTTPIPARSTPDVAPRRTTVPPRQAAAATLDSLPSRDALEVLASIPEPIAGSTPSGSVPVPARTSVTDPTSPPASSPPSTPEPITPRDSVTGPIRAIDHSVPVPAPTRPMGDDPDVPVTMPSVEPLQSPPPPSTPPPSTPVAPVMPTSAEAVWRLQVGAPSELEKAEVTRRAAESQLLVAFVIEHEAGLHKVRSSGRLLREVAERLRTRAIDSGFAGAFLLRQPASR